MEALSISLGEREASVPPTADLATDWRAFRAAFPTTGRFVYLDTARKALVPQWT